MEARMSRAGIEFVSRWVTENIQATGLAPDEGLHPETEETLRRMLADADTAAISRGEIEEDMGDLSEFISAALDEATEAEIDRLEDEDDGAFGA
jgi:hypothetical protein